MKSSINLIDYKNKIFTNSASDIQKIIRIIAVSLLFIVSALSVILFMLIILSPLPELRKQESNARATLSQSRSDIAKLSLIKERTDNIATIIEKRPYFDKTIEKLLSTLPEGVEVNAISLKDKTVSVTVVGESLESVDQFLNEISRSADAEDAISRVILTNFSTGEDSDTIFVDIALNIL